MQAGLGKQRLVAAASENSAFEREESGPGSARSHDDEILSLCLHAQAGLAFLGMYNDKALIKSCALVFSLAAIISPLVLPVTVPSPTPSSSTVKACSISVPSQAALSLASNLSWSHALLSSSPSLHPEERTTDHLVVVGAPDPQHAPPPHVFSMMGDMSPMRGMEVSRVPM